jgi:hypothetical protein
MAAPHAGFASVTVVSEDLINRCLATYVNTFLGALTGRIRRNVPAVVNGSSLTFDVSADAVLLWARAHLRKNAQGIVSLTFRFYAVAQLDVSQPGSATPFATYKPEIALDVAVTTSLFSLIQNDQIQFGADMAQSTIDSITVVTLAAAGVPVAYRSVFVQALQSFQARGVLYALLRMIAPGQLMMTPGVAPSQYEFAFKKPVQRDEWWANVRIGVGRIIGWPLDGALAVAVDVLGYTTS